MTQIRADLPPLPRRMTALPIDDRGFPVPWFVDWLDGRPILEGMARKQGEPAIAELQQDLKRFAPILEAAFADGRQSRRLPS